MKSTQYNQPSTQQPNHEIQWTEEDLKAIRRDIERDREFEREIYREDYEKDINGRRKYLNASFSKEIIDYLYADGPVPRRMDCWDAPVDWLKAKGLQEEVLREELWNK